MNTTKKILLIIVTFVLLSFGSSAYAQEENYNPTAVKNASQAAISNANCNSALNLDCSEPSISNKPIRNQLSGSATDSAVEKVAYSLSIDTNPSESAIENLIPDPTLSQGLTSTDQPFSVSKEWELGAGGFPGGDTGLANTVSYMSSRTNAVFSSPSPKFGNNLWVIIISFAVFFFIRRRKTRDEYWQPQ